MENTLQNKQKFIAQYWGVRCMQFVGFLEKVSHICMNRTNASEKSLMLKPLKSITSEDAIQVATLWYLGKVEDVPDLEELGRKLVVDDFCIPMHMSDYLRSKGYALPWMGLSVTQLVEYGWIKLTHNEKIQN